MEHVELMPGQWIVICADREEANNYCKASPIEKHLVWLESETWDHCLDSPEELQAVIDAKKIRPGVKSAT